jgi:ferredoxin-NADP reductase
VLNDIALGHLQKQGLKAVQVERLQMNLFAGDDWAAYLDRLGICDERHRRIASEAGLLDGLVAKGASKGSEIWFCGPAGLAEVLRNRLRSMGTMTRFHQEAFEMRKAW